jgi:hypothetical protein
VGVRTRPAAVPVSLLAALVLAACSPDLALEPVTDPPTTSERPTVAPVNPSAFAEDAAFGQWRLAPIRPTSELATLVEDACRDDALVGDLPLAVLDARGLGLFTLVFADGSSAALCRVAVDEVDRSVEVVARAVNGAAGAEAPAARELGIHDLELVDESTSLRRVAVGMVGDGVNTVEVSFDDETWGKASMNNGWWATWWSGTAEALAIAAVDSRNVVITSFAP